MPPPVDVITDVNGPRKFAERYMQREIYLPFMSNMSGLLYLPDMTAQSEIEKIYKKSYKDKTPMRNKTIVHALERETIGADTKEKIYVALHELTQAMTIDINILKKMNKGFVKKRKEAIRYLGKILKNPLIEKRQIMVEELKRLRAFDKNSKQYKEIDFMSSWHHMFYTGLLKKLVLKVETRKISEMLSIPMNFKKGRPQRFFIRILLIVIFRYLHEYAKLPKEKAKCLTLEVINEYIEKKGCPNSASIDYKDIDKALGEL